MTEGTREWAIWTLKNKPGVKITHRFFDENEYIVGRNDSVYTEEGYLFEDWITNSCDGMRGRTGGAWELGWDLYKPKQRLVRFSGYIAGEGISADDVEEALQKVNGVFQQVHIDESVEFDDKRVLSPNCDLALLSKHFECIPKEVDTSRLVVGGTYKHFKEGVCVTVIGTARHTETEEPLVVYTCSNGIWVRPLEMFLSEVDKEQYPRATQKYRFELVG